MQLVVKFSNCVLQIRILILHGFQLLCQCCIRSLQLSHLLFEAMDLQSLVLLQVKDVECILCSSGQLSSSHVSSKLGWKIIHLSLIFYHPLMSNSPGFICLVMDWQVCSWSKLQLS